MAVLLLRRAVRPHATWREQTVDETNFSISFRDSPRPALAAPGTRQHICGLRQAATGTKRHDWTPSKTRALLQLSHHRPGSGRRHAQGAGVLCEKACVSERGSA